MSLSIENAIRLCEEGRCDEALSVIDALMMDPASAVERNQLASAKVNILMHTGRLAEAAALAREIVARTSPESIQCLNARHQIAAVLQLEGKNLQAAKEYAEIIAKEQEVNSTGTESWFFDFMRLQRGICLVHLKQFDRALEALLAVREADQMPADWFVEWNYYRGLCFFELCDFSNASVSLTRVLGTSNSANLAKALYYLAQAEHENGRPKAAAEALARLAKMPMADVPAEYVQTLRARLAPEGPGSM